MSRHTSAPSIPTRVPAVDWAQAVAEPAEPVFDDVEFSHPLWVLFSSGTTGIPKGIVHGHGGALLEEMKMLLIHSDLRPGDRYLNVASTSWVLWNALVSALGVGATAVLVDGNPTFPSIDRVWQIAAAEQVAVLGVGAGFVHSCAKAPLVPMRDHDLGALKSLQVTGSPLSADGYRWVYGNVGDIWLSSMSGGTDIASIFVEDPRHCRCVSATSRLRPSECAWSRGMKPAIPPGQGRTGGNQVNALDAAELLGRRRQPLPRELLRHVSGGVAARGLHRVHALGHPHPRPFRLDPQPQRAPARFGRYLRGG